MLSVLSQAALPMYFKTYVVVEAVFNNIHTSSVCECECIWLHR